MRMVAVIIFSFLFLELPAAQGADKVWSSLGDGVSWSDDDNWLPASVPTSVDDVLIDATGASIVCGGTYKAKSVTMGGRESVSLTSNNFVFGTISPDAVSDLAILNRLGGTIKLTGAGILTVRGRYKDSEETLVQEPSFMFWVE